MRKTTLASIALLLCAASPALVSARQAPKRLHFKRGQTRITVGGYLRSPGDSAAYLLRVRARQNIEVRPCGGSISIGTDVADAATRTSGDHDMQGNSGFTNTVAGDYVVTVTPSGKDDRRKGSFRVSIQVTDSTQ